MQKRMVLKEFKDYVGYRTAWMGFAILWVMCFHFWAETIPFISRFLAVGYGGVDIFFYASGIGCWYSLSKSPNSITFLKHRAARILPTYLPFITVFIIVKALDSESISVQEILGNVFWIGSLLGMNHQFNWYLGGLFVFYIIAPVLVEFVNQNVGKKRNLFYMFLFLVVFSLCFVNHYAAIVVSSRMPIAYLGIVSAALGNKNTAFSKKTILLMLFLSLCGIIWLSGNYLFFSEYLWNYGLYWYPFILITPGVCYVISCLCKQIKSLNLVFGTIGTHCFELYLLHIPLLLAVENLQAAGFLPDSYYLPVKTAAFFLSFPCAYLMKKVVNWCWYSRKRDGSAESQRKAVPPAK